MSEQLQVGDRARVVFNKEGRIYGGEGYLYENTSQILGAEGIVTAIHGDEITLTETRTTRLVMAAECLTRIETQRRNFEEIIKELGWWYSPWNKRAEKQYDEFSANIYSDGSLECVVQPNTCMTRIELPASELAAIAAACTEIAANYQAEQEEQQ